MTRTLIAMLACLLLAGRAGADESGTDPAIAPGDDFFGYANGEWLRSTEIPAGKGRWTVGSELAEPTRKRVDDLIASGAAAQAGSSARRIADYRAAWLDAARIEARGVAPLKPMLDRIERIGDRKALARVLGEFVRADVDPLNWGVYDASHVFGLAVQEGNNGETQSVAYLMQGGLGMPRERFVGTDERSAAQRALYEAHIAKQLSALRGGAGENIQRRAHAVMALETAIAEAHATPEQSSNDHNAGNLWPREDFVRRAPGLEWGEFLRAAGLARLQGIVVWQPDATVGIASLTASMPLAVWKDYLRVHLVDRYADVLPRAMADEALAFRAAIGSPSPRDREASADEATRKAFTMEIGRLYVARYFPPEQKARVEKIVASVVAALDRRVDALEWLSPHGKQVAHVKLATLYIGVGYPETWPHDPGFEIKATDAFGNQVRTDARDRYRALAKLGKPVDTKEWSIAPHSTGAVLIFQLNAYQFAAGLLQPTKFDPAASEATNYGSIGAVIGHDAVHFIDTLGAEYEPGGRNHRWWTTGDVSRYEAQAEALAQQYAAYRPFADAAVDAKLTLNENAADLAGLAAAFDAHRLALGDRINDKDYVRGQDREFFIGYARAWRGKAREEEQRKLLKSDNHAPERYRVATVRNLDGWYEAFDVRPGQKLYLPPEARVRIW